MKPPRLLSALVAYLLVSCASPPPAENSAQTNIEHSLLRPGQELSLRNRHGAVTVRWKDDFARTYIVNGVAYTAQLVGRPEEFYGPNGIYSPAEQHTKADDRKHPPRRFVVEESRVDFESGSALEAYLREGAEYHAWVANADGHVAGYAENPQRDQVNVSVFRFYLHGKPVSKIPSRYLSKGVIISPRKAVVAD